MSNLYTIAVVDDEPWALVYMKQLFDRADLGFQVIAATQSPEEAVRLIEREKPDILVTDIRMPGINGIELIEHVRHMDIPCEVVILSGFAEFAYAQQAITLGAFEYCLKPLSRESAACVLRKLRARLESKASLCGPGETLEANDDNFVNMLHFIERHYDQRLYLKDLAQKFYLAPNYCCSLFVKYKKMTFSQYVTELRMQKAMQLLTQQGLSINKVAQRVGFDDYTYFNKVFKRYFQCTPSEYKKNLAGCAGESEASEP
mgnify:CR=1 FL=1